VKWQDIWRLGRRRGGQQDAGQEHGQIGNMHRLLPGKREYGVASVVARGNNLRAAEAGAIQELLCFFGRGA
jgi:hypothetical protein